VVLEALVVATSALAQDLAAARTAMGIISCVRPEQNAVEMLAANLGCPGRAELSTWLSARRVWARQQSLAGWAHAGIAFFSRWLHVLLLKYRESRFSETLNLNLGEGNGTARTA